MENEEHSNKYVHVALTSTVANFLPLPLKFNIMSVTVILWEGLFHVLQFSERFSIWSRFWPKSLILLPQLPKELGITNVYHHAKRDSKSSFLSHHLFLGISASKYMVAQ